jgi:lipoate-protein ligase A
MDCRLIKDRPASGAWNMAADEALLRSISRAGQGSALRFYYWDQPTVSLGYFQNAADRRSHGASLACPLVRRATGGGAIVHDLELTYSFVVPADSRWAGKPGELYDAFHGTLVQELGERGIPARLCIQGTPQRRDEPFLCFQRRAPGDVLLGDQKIAGSAQRRFRGGVLLGDQKIAGSAQRRFRGGVLQHGSVIIGMSARCPEIAGIERIAQLELSADELADRWTARLQSALGLRMNPASLVDMEVETATDLVEQKFSCGGWTLKR